MTYQETLEFMYAQLPMYHRVGAAAYKADIQPTIDMMNALGNPERRFPSIHVAGTNGKGSVSHFLASILQEAGYVVGLYTSPHLVDFRERIRINGEMISQEAVVDFISRTVQQQADNPAFQGLSFFELTVGMAFDYFAKEQVDIAVVEVGMGGRLDSTNVITPQLSIITNIGLDHTQFLGDTLEKIAAEKAGIIKPGVPVVIGESQPETAQVFRRVSAECNAPLLFADRHYKVSEVEPEEPCDSPDSVTYSVQHITGKKTFTLQSQLSGSYQQKNLATVLSAVDELRKHTVFDIQPEELSRGIARVVSNTHLQGRWQTIGTTPLTICETAHNEPGIRAMASKLSGMTYGRLHLVYGCVNDKDYRHILQLLSKQMDSPCWYFSQPSVPRRLPVEELQAAAAAMGIEGQAYTDVKQAIEAARAAAAPDDLVLVTGSIFLVADALA